MKKAAGKKAVRRPRNPFVVPARRRRAGPHADRRTRRKARRKKIAPHEVDHWT